MTISLREIAPVVDTVPILIGLSVAVLLIFTFDRFLEPFLTVFPVHGASQNRTNVVFPMFSSTSAALQIGTNTIDSGYTPDLDKETFTSIVSRSWEMIETNKQLDEHKTVKGWSVGPLATMIYLQNRS